MAAVELKALWETVVDQQKNTRSKYIAVIVCMHFGSEKWWFCEWSGQAIQFDFFHTIIKTKKWQSESSLGIRFDYVVEIFLNVSQFIIHVLKFLYSEKATKFCEIFPLILTTVHTVKSKGEISQNFVAFSEYMNFTFCDLWKLEKKVTLF